MNTNCAPQAHLIVAGSEAPSNILVVQHLNLKAEILLQILDQHHQEGQLDAKGFGWVSRARDVSSTHIRAHDFQHTRSNIIVCDPFNVSVTHCKTSMYVELCSRATCEANQQRFTFFVPYLKRLASNTV